VFFCIKQGVAIVVEEISIISVINDIEEWKYKSPESSCSVPPVARAPGTETSPCYARIWSIELAAKRQSLATIFPCQSLSLRCMRWHSRYKVESVLCSC